MYFIDILCICMMITSLGVFGLRNYKLAVKCYALQAVLLVLIFFSLFIKFDANELLIWGITAFFTKVVLVPYLLFKLIKKLEIVSEDEPVGGFFISPVIAVSFSLAISMMIYPVFMEFSLIKNDIALISASFIFIMGIAGFILRNSFVKQILAYCLFENGIHLSLALMAYNAHELVEVGILTDAIFAVIIMSILAVRFKENFGDINTSNARNLKG